MRREISFGKIAYYSTRRINEITINIELKNDCISLSGNIWNGSHTDCYSCGQNLDEIYEFKNQLKNKELFEELYFYWKKYHLKKLPEKFSKRVEKIIDGNYGEDEESRRIRIMAVFE